ncbi:MAG TPA: hypothetical protein VNL92_03575 [Dehalococcoidia bacterium]|nr:hypothetical protein [Dehalococcoidia bacterium]
MTIVLLWKDGTEDSLLGNLALAIESKKAGEDVTVIVTEEALAAMAGKGYTWSQALKDRPSRMTILKAAKELGLPYHRDFDPRWTEPAKLVDAAHQAGIRLVADPIWVKLLGLDGNLPEAVERIETSDMLKTLREASVVVGGF